MKCHLQTVWHLIISQRDRICVSNKISRVSVEPWETHALTSVKEETCPLSSTPCFQFLKKLNKFKMLSDVPFCFSFRMSSCHTLSKCFKNWDTFDDLHYLLYKKKNKT